MPLINLTTNLKDLKYGRDRYHEGSSKQPYIQTRIPATDEPLQTSFVSTDTDAVIQAAGEIALLAGTGALIGGGAFGSPVAGAAAGAAFGLLVSGDSLFDSGLKVPTAGTGGKDFLLRGGSLLPGRIAKDEERLIKYFASTDGILFTIKQNILSNSAVRTQASGVINDKVYLPTSTLAQAGVVAFGGHLNKQGLNPFSGLKTPGIPSPDQYFDAIKASANPNDSFWEYADRLNVLYGFKILNDDTTISRVKKDINIDINGIDILTYRGGPGSDLGIGKTFIKFATDNVGNPLRVSNIPTVTETIAVSGYPLLNYLSNSTRENNRFSTLTEIRDFRKGLKPKSKTIISNSPSYDYKDNKTLETRVNLGDPGNPKLKNITSYTNGYLGEVNQSFGAASPNSVDKINRYPIYQSDKLSGESDFKGDKNDLVKFAISVLDTRMNTSKHIHFRAFLDQISDNYSANWQDTQYIGRGEKFYNYTGFDRKVSLGWTVAAQSKAELTPMYRKLNYLASICAPNYSPSGYMQGNIVKLTIGGYFWQQPGIITSLNYEMNDDNSTWEIGINDEGNYDPSVKELPHLIKVTNFNFIPIHTFVPKLQENIFDNKNILTDYGKERYIALANGGGANFNNYDSYSSIGSTQKLNLSIPSQPVTFYTGPNLVLNPNNIPLVINPELIPR